MRQRLVAAFVGLAVLSIALYGIPRAYVVADLVRSEQQSRVDREADLVAWAVDNRLDAGGAVTSSYLDSLNASHESIVVSTAAGTRIVTSVAPAGHHDLSARRALATGGSVTVSRDGHTVRRAVTGAVAPLVVLGLLLVLLSAVAGFLLARRLARPFQELAAAARGLGTWQLQPRLPEYRVPEAQAIGTALTASGTQIEDLLRRERALAVHASHELRTPVTALRLQLEDLALWPETPPSVTAQLHEAVGELDRLSSAIGDLLDLARDRRQVARVDVELGALVEEVVAPRRASGDPVLVRTTGAVRTRLQPDTLRQVVDLVLDETLSAGQEVCVVVEDRGSHLEIRAETPHLRDAADQDEDARRVWADARDLAADLGGQLVRDESLPAAVLRLPRRSGASEA